MELTEAFVKSKIYNQIKTPPKLFTTKVELVDYYPHVTEEDIDNGSLTRYFVRQANHSSGEITEIDWQTYQRIQLNPLYKTVAIEWKISGNLDDVMGPNDINTPIRLYTGVRTANRLAVEQAENELSGIKYKLINLIQFWIDGHGVVLLNSSVQDEVDAYRKMQNAGNQSFAKLTLGTSRLIPVPHSGDVTVDNSVPQGAGDDFILISPVSTSDFTII